MQFWQDSERTRLNPELFSGIAEEAAKRIAEKSSDRTNAPTQLRKFYDEVVALASSIKAQPQEFDNLLPYLKMLNAKAAYAQARNSLISPEFKQFLKEAIDQIQNTKDVDVFLSYFEAFMGFYKFYYDEHKKAQQSRGGRR